MKTNTGPFIATLDADGYIPPTMRGYGIPKLVLITLLLIFSTSTIAAPRQKIGLVLGGGGAKAGTQVGVLRVMEELRIPVDFVVGTSMGSFIGVLYAMGYPLKDIEAVLSNTVWSDVFNDATDRKMRPYRRKQDDYNYLIDYKLGVNKEGLILPKGIMGTQRLRLLIRELSLHVAHIKNFDELPLPYRAIAIDIGTGTEVVQGEGELPDCVRASMSLPGIFPPVVIKGKHLVDGGSANNLPVSVAKARGMDAIIAVDVGADFQDAEKLSSFIAVMDQLTLMLTRGSTLRAYDMAGPKDVMIRPDLTGFTTESYEKISETFGRGEEAARKAEVFEKLKKFSVPEAEYAAFKAKRERPVRPVPMIQEVRINTKQTEFARRVIDKMVRARPHEPLNVEQIHEDVESLYAFDAFKEVRYDIEPKENGQQALVFTPMDDERLKNFIRLGLRFETDFNSSTIFGAAISTNFTRLNSYGAELRVDGEVGNKFQFFSEFYQPYVSSLKAFIAPEVRLQRRTINIFNGEDIVAEGLISSARMGLGTGYVLSNWGEFRVGFLEDFGKVRQSIGTLTPPSNSYETGRYFAKFSHDTVDNFDFPHNGMIGRLEWQQSFDALGDFAFKKYEGKYLGFKTFSHHTFGLGAEGGGSIDENLPLSDFFQLGGLFKLSGYQREELSGQYDLLGRLLYYYRLGGDKLAIVNVPTYVGFSAETGNVWKTSDDISFDSMIWSGSAFVGIDTMFGPIILAGGFSEGSRYSLNLLVGQPF